MKLYAPCLWNVAGLMFIVSAWGCAHAVKPAGGVVFTNVPDRINLRVRLGDVNELRNTTWHSADSSEFQSAPLGANLASNASELVRNVFAPSGASGGAGSAGLHGDGEYVLTPKLVVSRYVHGGSAWDEARFTICLEWRLATPSGKIKWIDTIKGQGIGKTSGGMDANLQLAIQDVFDKSQKAMLSSKVLREINQAPDGQQPKDLP